MAGKGYFSFSMLRRLFACLALVTGLAAVGAPAQAALVDALEQMEISAERSDKGKSATCPCEERHEQQRQRGEKPTPCTEERAVRIYIPSVMLGVDRALE